MRDVDSTPAEAGSVVLTSEFVLRDGLMVSVRPVVPDDEAALWEFLTNLSIRSRHLRFFSSATDMRTEAHRGVASDDAEHHGILALASGRGIVGHAIYVRAAHCHSAEVAVEVADDLHNLGLATQLVIRLAQLAEQRQITHFLADVLPRNHDMLAVLRDGFDTVTIRHDRELEVRFPTSGWRAAHALFAGEPNEAESQQHRFGQAGQVPSPSPGA